MGECDASQQCIECEEGGALKHFAAFKTFFNYFWKMRQMIFDVW